MCLKEKKMQKNIFKGNFFKEFINVVINKH